MGAIRAMIVEDEVLISMVLARELERLGCEVVASCVSGEDALVQDERHAPELVFMDVKLAGKLDGIEVARRIAARRKVGFVFSSAFSLADLESRVRPLSPLAILPKPVSRGEIAKLMADLGYAAPPAKPR